MLRQDPAERKLLSPEEQYALDREYASLMQVYEPKNDPENQAFQALDTFIVKNNYTPPRIKEIKNRYKRVLQATNNVFFPQELKQNVSAINKLIDLIKGNQDNPKAKAFIVDSVNNEDSPLLPIKYILQEIYLLARELASSSANFSQEELLPLLVRLLQEIVKEDPTLKMNTEIFLDLSRVEIAILFENNNNKQAYGNSILQHNGAMVTFCAAARYVFQPPEIKEEKEYTIPKSDAEFNN
jgi:hypothetical protein